MPRDFSRMQVQIDCQKAGLVSAYPAIWQRIAAEWQADEAGDHAWLIYAANYLLRTAGTRWAIDPLALQSRIPEAAAVDAARDLRGLSFVLLTHRHADHLDLSLVHALRHEPIWWVVPAFLYDRVVEQAGIPKGRVIIPKMLEPIQMEGVTITPFKGLHWEYVSGVSEASLRGVSALGYLAEFQQTRWLFPGDTRHYDANQIPPFGRVDGVFAHLWLGRKCALLEKPPLLEAFCDFFLALQPRRVFIAHLNELGRAPDDYWDQIHFDRVLARFRQIAPDLPVRACFLGDRIDNF